MFPHHVSCVAQEHSGTRINLPLKSMGGLSLYLHVPAPHMRHYVETSEKFLGNFLKNSEY